MHKWNESTSKWFRTQFDLWIRGKSSNPRMLKSPTRNASKSLKLNPGVYTPLTLLMFCADVWWDDGADDDDEHSCWLALQWRWTIFRARQHTDTHTHAHTHCKPHTYPSKIILYTFRMAEFRRAYFVLKTPCLLFRPPSPFKRTNARACMRYSLGLCILAIRKMPSAYIGVRIKGCYGI